MTPGNYTPPQKDYKIVSALSMWGMANKAKKLMNKEGWTPLGGICQSWGILYQAFTK